MSVPMPWTSWSPGTPLPSALALVAHVTGKPLERRRQRSRRRPHFQTPSLREHPPTSTGHRCPRERLDVGVVVVVHTRARATSTSSPSTSAVRVAASLRLPRRPCPRTSRPRCAVLAVVNGRGRGRGEEEDEVEVEEGKLCVGVLVSSSQVSVQKFHVFTARPAPPYVSLPRTSIPSLSCSVSLDSTCLCPGSRRLILELEGRTC